jgi:hypothetical protein
VTRGRVFSFPPFPFDRLRVTKTNKEVLLMKEIIIKKIENRENYFMAYYKNDLLKSSFCVCFPDTILGAVCLNEFFQMLKLKYTEETFQFVVSDQSIKLKNVNLLDEMTLKKEAV